VNGSFFDKTHVNNNLYINVVKEMSLIYQCADGYYGYNHKEISNTDFE